MKSMAREKIELDKKIKAAMVEVLKASAVMAQIENNLGARKKLMQSACKHQWEFTVTREFVGGGQYGYKTCSKCGKLVPCEIDRN